MQEFFRVWEKCKQRYDLERIVKKSIFDGFEMRIYRDDKLIIKVKADDDEQLYHQAALSLKRYRRTHDY